MLKYPIIHGKSPPMKKYVFPLILCLCGFGLLFIGWQPAFTPFSLHLIHTNDLHSHLLPFDNHRDCALNDSSCLGGLARISAFMKQQKIQNPQTVILDAGDRFTGTAFYTLTKSQYLTPLFQNMSYDAITLGNHEFDDNIAETESFLKSWQVPVLVANIQGDSNEALLKRTQPFLILERNHRKIGIIGALTLETNVFDGHQITLAPPIESVAAIVRQMKQNGVNIIIVLSHIGLPEDIRLAEAVPDIDIIVGGHSHSLLTNNEANPNREGPYPIVANQGKTLIVTCGMGGQFVGSLDVTFDENGEIITHRGDTVPMNNSIAPDSQSTEIIREAVQEVDQILSRPIATLAHSYDFTPQANYCSENCTVGAYLGHLLAQAIPEADGAIINSGSIRRALPAGVVQYRHIIETYPFECFRDLIEISNSAGTKTRGMLKSGIVSRPLLFMPSSIS